jgi:hypothetical protein
MVGAGAVVTHDVPAGAVVVGSPASIVGYARSGGEKANVRQMREAPTEAESTVRGVEIVELSTAVDLRGSLVFGQVGGALRFRPARFFVVYDVPSRETRGEHAHRQLEQFLVCVKGECRLMVDDSTRRQEIELNRPTLGVYLAPMVWAVQYRFSRDAALLVLASDSYSGEDYIRDYDVFLSECAGVGS